MTFFQRLCLAAGLATALALNPNEADAQSARTKKLQENNRPQTEQTQYNQHTYHLQNLTIQYDHGSGDITRVVAFGSRDPDQETGAIDESYMDFGASRTAPINSLNNTNVIEFNEITLQGDPNTTNDRSAYVKFTIHPSPLSRNKVAFTLMRGQTGNAPFSAGQIEKIESVTYEGFVQNLDILDSQNRPSGNPRMDAQGIIDNSRTYGQPIFINEMVHRTLYGTNAFDAVINSFRPAPGGMK